MRKPFGPTPKNNQPAFAAKPLRMMTVCLIAAHCMTLVAAAGGAGKNDKKANSDEFTKPEILDAQTNPMLRYPVMRLSGLSIKSMSCGWLDVSRTAIRYTVVQPAKKADAGFDLPMAYIYLPAVSGRMGNPWNMSLAQIIDSLNSGELQDTLHFFGGAAGEPRKKNIFFFMPQDRWGTVHTAHGFQGAARRGRTGTESIAMAMSDFNSVFVTVLTGPLLKDNPSLVLSKDRNGATLLHSAAALGLKGAVELLLANGADVNAKSSDDRTPVRVAMSSGHKDVAELLRQHGGHE